MAISGCVSARRNSSSFAASRSVTSAAVTITSSTRPLLSQIRCRFRPLTFLASSHPRLSLATVSDAWGESALRGPSQSITKAIKRGAEHGHWSPDIRRWAVAEVTGVIRDQLRRQVRLASGKTPRAASAIVDSQSIKELQHRADPGHRSNRSAS